MRVTWNRLEVLLGSVVTALGLPVKVLEVINGQIYWNVGALRLDFNENYGGWDLEQVIGDHGVVESLVGNCFAGTGRLKAREMELFLLGMLAALERAKGGENDKG